EDNRRCEDVVWHCRSACVFPVEQVFGLDRKGRPEIKARPGRPPGGEDRTKALELRMPPVVPRVEGDRLQAGCAGGDRHCRLVVEPIPLEPGSAGVPPGPGVLARFRARVLAQVNVLAGEAQPTHDDAPTHAERALTRGGALLVIPGPVHATAANLHLEAE